MSLVQIRSAAFPNVHVRLDGQGVTHPVDPGAGIVNAQYGAGPWETFQRVDNPDGTVSFQSNAFPNVFLRLDGRGVTHPVDPGAGVVNAQYTAGPWEKFRIVTNDDTTRSIASVAFPNVFLRLDGRGVTHPVDSGAGVVNAQYTAGPWEKFVLCDCLTHDQVNGAMDKFIEWFPEEAGNINSHRQQIMNACCPPYTSSGQDLSALAAVRHAASPPQLQALPAPGLTPCQIAIGTVAYDGASLALSLVGLNAMNNDRIRHSLYQQLGPHLNALRQRVQDLQLAQGARAKAEALFTLLGQVWSAGGFRAIWKILKDEMSWWEWIKTGVIAVAQIIAWFATEGTAFVAEVVLVIMSAEQLIEDTATAVRTCSR